MPAPNCPVCGTPTCGECGTIHHERTCPHYGQDPHARPPAPPPAPPPNFARSLRNLRRDLAQHLNADRINDYVTPRSLRSSARSDAEHTRLYEYICGRLDGPICYNCARLEGDCTCHACDECGNMRRTLCDCCDRCENCCSCQHCSRCGTCYSSDDSEDEDQGYCSNCMEVTEVRRDVGDTFHGEPSARYPRYLGVEIECGLNGQANTRALKSVLRDWDAGAHDDGSINLSNSVEVVSAPARGEDFIRQIVELTDALHGCGATVDTSCGLHVHVDARDLTGKEVLSLVRLYARVEPALYELVSPSRRSGQYSGAWGPLFREMAVLDAAPRAERLRRLDIALYGSEATARRVKENKDKHGSRYHGLNLNALAVHGTIEFRLHQGTVNKDKILMWAAVCSAIVAYAKAHSEYQIKKLAGESEDVLCTVVADKELVKWIKERRMFFRRRFCSNRGIEVVVPPSVAAERAEFSEAE